MKSLKVLAGPNPNELAPVIPGQVVRIHSASYSGTLCFNYEQNPHTQPPQNYSGPRKKFSIQSVGQYLNTRLNRPLTYDDVMFGVEFDRPVAWRDIPIPTWLVRAFYKWLRNLSDDLEIRNIFQDEYPVKDLEELFCSHPRHRPSISTPIVCAASTMNVIPAYQTNLAAPMRQSTPDGLAAFVELPRQIWTKYRYHQYETDLIEFNSYLFTSIYSLGPFIDRTPHDRRLYLRGKLRDTKGYPFPSNQTQQIQYVSPLSSSPYHPLQSRLRRQLPFDPNFLYAFDFWADYFDFSTFELCPRFSRGTGNSLIPNGAISNLLNGRWHFDVTKYLAEQGPAVSKSSFTIFCKLNQTTEYFWCLKFEMSQS